MQNTQKLQQIPQKSVKYAVLCVQSGKFYTGQIFFTRAPPVVPATNMRYGLDICQGYQNLSKIILKIYLKDDIDKDTPDIDIATNFLGLFAPSGIHVYWGSL